MRFAPLICLFVAGQLACASAPPPQRAAPPRAGGDQASEPENTGGDRRPFETGIASFYHPSLAGNETANGERYQPSERTCAHPSLPFGTAVEVKLVRTGASAVCRVNDRGPFAKGRVIDLSQGMAEALGVQGDDIHKVELYRAD